MPQIHSGGNTQSLFYVRKKILFSSSSELCVTFRDDDFHFFVQLRVCRMTNKWTLKNTEWTDSLQILSQCKCFFVIMKLCRLVFSLMTDRREIIGYTAQVRSLSGSLISITSLLLHIVPPSPRSLPGAGLHLITVHSAHRLPHHTHTHTMGESWLRLFGTLVPDCISGVKPTEWIAQTHTCLRNVDAHTWAHKLASLACSEAKV